MLRGLFERWWRFCLSLRHRLLGRGAGDEDAAARMERLWGTFEARFARAARQIEKIEAAAKAAPPRRGPWQLRRKWSRAERRVRSMVEDASRSAVRRRTEYNHAEAVAEMERRLESLRACLADVEAERDQAAENAVSWHRRGRIAVMMRDASLARGALEARRQHEVEYLRCAHEARKIKAILDEMRRAADVLAAMGREQGPK